jgi:cation transport protein ChaC
MRRIELEDHARRRVRALCYVIDRSHVQYAGRLTLAESLHHVRQGHGQSGPNRDYVLETVRALEALGYRETELHLLAEQLKGVHEKGAAHP